MNEGITALSVSLFFHAAMVGLLGFLSFNRTPLPEYITVNFSLENPQGATPGHQMAQGKAAYAKGGERRKRDDSAHNEKLERPAPSSLSQAPAQEAVDRKPSETTTVGSAIENQISPGVGQGIGYHEGVSLSGGDRHGTSMSSGSGSRVLDYGRGGSEERNFLFIRETIMSSIRYPERARRMGWEGTVLLSFIVLENGRIEEVKIVSGSGYHTLDDHAKEVVEKTSFKRKMPYKLIVLLPVEYRLK